MGFDTKNFVVTHMGKCTKKDEKMCGSCLTFGWPERNAPRKKVPAVKRSASCFSWQIPAAWRTFNACSRKPGTTLVIRKYIEGTENEPLSGVAFKVVDGNGAAVGPDDGVYYTDKAGEIVLNGIEPGTTVKAREIKTVDGFVLDGTPQDIQIKAGEVQSLTFWNKRAGTLLIEKLDSITKAPLAGAQFKVCYADGRVVDTEGGKLSSNGIYTTDKNGQIKITQVAGTLVVTEEKAPDGYVMDANNKSQTVIVNPNDTQTLRFYNEPLCSLTLTKVDSVTNKPVPNTEFTVKDGNGNIVIRCKTGNLVDTIKSDQRSLAASKPLPLGRYTVKEVKAPANYGVSDTVLSAYLEHEGQIVSFEVADKSLTAGVSITKTGPKETMAGQPVRYQFSGIANRSNVRLDSFYWRDTLPAQVRLDTVVTGTYNFPGTYKITYRVNGGEPRTLADSLSTSQNYTLAASPVALGLAANERVTEIMFVFGQAPAGFAQVETPMLHCTALASLKGGTSFVNVADVGGVYNGVWVQGISRWVTTVYGKPTPLPKTGY